MIHFQINDSKIYPGTENNISVYVPSSYDPSKPACLFLKLDGIAGFEPNVIENLIAAKQIPVTILVGVSPGTLWKDKSKKEPYHFNRTYEFDSTNDNFPSFLEQEVLPTVEKQVTPDGKPIHLSHNANDHAIGGSSTGGIGSFTVAWRRPDMFSRVYSTIGTFVAMRGGDEYPTYIRKTEPKPIRVFLEDGYSDAWNPLFGSWFMANQNMEAALTFAGYDVAHLWADHGHSGAVSNAVYPNVLRWLWRDYPTPIHAGISANNKLKTILAPGEAWQQVGNTFKDAKGLAANPVGEVVLADPPDHIIYKIDVNGKAAPYIRNAPAIASEAFDTNGTLYATIPDASEVVTIDPNGLVRTIASGVKGHDITVTSAGEIFVSEPGDHCDDPSNLWRIKTTGEKTLLDQGLSSANAIAVSPNHNLLLAAEKTTQWIYVYVLRPDGTVQDKQRFYWLHQTDIPNNSGTEDMCFDTDGSLYTATNMGIQVCDQNGRVRAILPLPTPCNPITSVCFGGPNFDTLYATDGKHVWKRKMASKGFAPWSPPILVKSEGAG